MNLKQREVFAEKLMDVGNKELKGMWPLYAFLIGIFLIASVFALPTILRDWRRARGGPHK